MSGDRIMHRLSPDEILTRIEVPVPPAGVQLSSSMRSAIPAISRSPVSSSHWITKAVLCAMRDSCSGL